MRIWLQCSGLSEQRFCWWKFLLHSSEHVNSGMTRWTYHQYRDRSTVYFMDRINWINNV